MDYLRQLDIISPERLSFPVHIVGVGGIGSPTALALAKMGCQKILLWDPDKVEDHNLPNQLYRKSDVGRYKVDASQEILSSFADATIAVHRVKVNGERLQGVVVAAVDSMESRRQIWERSVKYRAGVPLFIDARMGGEVLRILSLSPTDPDSIERYEQTLHSDVDSQELACTAQAVIYNTFSVAALIANQVRRFAADGQVDFEIIFDLHTLTLLSYS